MATLDDLDVKSYPPLDIMTPIADQRGLPTQRFSDRQRQFERTIIAQHNENRAAINEEAEVRAGADFANALYVNQATAEALGFEAGVMMRMEAGVSPAGVVARYQIVGRVVPDTGPQVLNGLYFDFIEDPLNPGQYLGQVQIDTDLFKLGRADENGVFPFYLDGSTVYIEDAVIKNLSIGTEKVALQAITEITTATQPISVGPNGNQIVLVDVPTVADNNGIIIQYSGFMALPAANPSNVGSWQILLNRNGSQIAGTPALDYDDNYAYPVAAIFVDETPGVDPEYQLLTNLIAGPGFFTVGGGQAIFTQYKR